MEDKNFNLNYEGFEENLIKRNEEMIVGKRGVQYVFKFDNGYGASIIKGYGTYGYNSDKWELGVLIFDESGDSELCYTTEIAYDVVGWLTDKEVREYLHKIKEL